MEQKHKKTPKDVRQTIIEISSKHLNDIKSECVTAVKAGHSLPNSEILLQADIAQEIYLQAVTDMVYSGNMSDEKIRKTLQDSHKKLLGRVIGLFEKKKLLRNQQIATMKKADNVRKLIRP